MNRKMEVLLALVIISALVLFIGINVFSSSFNSDRVLDQLRRALDERDMKFLKDHLVYENGDRIPEEEIRAIYAAAEEKQIVLSDSQIMLKDHQEEGDGLDRIYPILIKEEGRKGLVYKNYKMVFSLYDLVVEIDDENIDQIKILVDGSEEEAEKIGNRFVCFGLKPGIKDVKIRFGQDFSQEILLEDLVLLEQGERELDLSAYNLDRSKDLTRYDFNVPVSQPVSFNTRYIHLYASGDRPDGVDVFLYVDGKKTDIRLDSDQPYEYGPVFEGQKAELQARFQMDGEDYASDIKQLEETYGPVYFNIDYEYIDPDQEDGLVRQALDQYLNGLVEAINSGSSFYLANILKPGSPIERDQEKLVDHLYSKGTREALLSYNINSLDRVSHGEYRLDVTERHRIYYKSGREEDVINRWVYTVMIEDGQAVFYEINKV